MSQHSGQVFNPLQAASSLGGEDVLLKVSQYFLEYVNSLMEPMETAMAAEDWQTLRKANHKLLGSVGNFGKNSAYRAVLLLEETLDRGEYAQVSRQYEKVMEEVTLLNKALRDFVRSVRF